MPGAKFVRGYGWVLLGFSILTFYAEYLVQSARDVPTWFAYVGVVAAAFYGLAGIGLLSYKCWGYLLLKVFLYILMLGFPIGTMISIWSLRYMRQNKIRGLFC